MKFFSLDSPLMQKLNFFSHFVLLNLLWVFTSLPLITIGASTTALFYCTMKLDREKDIAVFQDFFSSFKENFLVSTKAWIILIIVGFILSVDLYFTGGITVAWIQMIFAGVLILTTFFILCVSLFIFPILARFHNTTKEAFRYSFILPFKHIKQTLVLVLIVVVLSMIYISSTLTLVYGTLCLFSFGVALLAYLFSKRFNIIFNNYIENEENSSI